MREHSTSQQIDIGTKIDELTGTQRTKQEVALLLIKKTLALGVNVGIARQELLGAVIQASNSQQQDEKQEFLIPAQANILLMDFCHVAGFDLVTHKEAFVKNEMRAFVHSNYGKPASSRAAR